MSTSCDPMDCSLPGSPVRGIFQARILEWIAISFSRGSSGPRNQTQVSWIAGRLLHCRQILTDWARREAHTLQELPAKFQEEILCYAVLITQSCQTSCDPMDCSPPGPSVHEILQARILEWVAMPSSRGSSSSPPRVQPTSPALQGGSLPVVLPVKRF